MQTFTTIAHNASEAAYPHLWQGLAGAWSPSLGVTGDTLRDVSGHGNHGTLTGMDPATDWQVSGGGWSLDFDGSNDYIPLSTPITSTMVAAAWVYARDLTDPNGEYFVAKWGGDFYIGVYLGNWIARSASAGGSQSALLQSTATANTWTHLAVSRTASTLTLWVNGVAKASTSAVGFQGGSSAPLTVARLSGFSLYADLRLDDLLIYSGDARAVIPTLARRRGIAFERKRRRVYSIPAGPAFKAAWAARATTIAGVLR